MTAARQDAPIRVAQVVGKMVGGGVEQVVMNYYRHIDRSRVQFDFLVDADSTLVPRDEIEGLGGRVLEVPPYQRPVAYQRELARLFRRERWPIVHSHINTLSVFPLRAAKRAGVPVRIAHSHATMGKGEIGRNLMKLALRPLANVYPTDRAACSKYAGEWLFGEGKAFTIIPNAVEIGAFRFDAVTRGGMRRSWGAGPGCCVVGNLGRMESTKNQAFLIDAFSHLHARHPDSLLVIAGCGSLRGQLEARACDLGVADCVRFLGQVDDASELYQGMDVFALPSLYEGFGMALLEAQVAGVPCVVSDRVSSEVVLSTGCKLVPLEAGASAWSREIWAQFENGVHNVISAEEFGRFDIENAGEKLIDFYLGLYGSIPQ